MVTAVEGNRENTATYARGNDPPVAGAAKATGAAQFAAGIVKLGEEGETEDTAGGNEGLGLGFQPFIPNPTTSALLYFVPHFDKVPQSAPKLSRNYRETWKNLENSKNSPIECKNRFQVLENFGTACVVSGELEKNNRWIFYCGATDTMTYDGLDIIKPHKPHLSHIETASGEFTVVKGAGTVKISPTLELSNCLHVPSLSHKLLSISHVTRELNCTLLMQPNFFLLQDIRNIEIIGRGTENNGLYYVDEIAQKGAAMLTHGTADREAWLWHRRLGHSSPGYLQMLFPNITLKSSMYCETCVFAKSHQNTYHLSNSRTETLFGLVHSDVWGPAPVIGGQGFKYFLIFVDDCTRMTWVYFMKHKSEVFEHFVHFYSLIQTQFQKPI